MKYIKTLAFFLAVTSLAAQDINIIKPLQNDDAGAGVEKDYEEKTLESQLNEARRLNNSLLASKLQSKLDKLRGHIPVYPECDKRFRYKFVNEYTTDDPDYQVSQIHNLNVWANAVATIPVGFPNAGHVWVAASDWGSGTAPDSIKFFRSTNNGVSWAYMGLIYLNFNYNFRRDELDIEIVYDGSTMWLFGVAGIDDLSDNGRDKVFFFRIPMAMSGTSYAAILNYPGISSPGNNYYNPRIVSDNSNYISNAHVMVLCSADSLHGGSSHILKQKYMLSTMPFNNPPSMNFNQPTPYGFHWTANTGTSGHYLYSDIGYYRDDGGSGSNRVFTVYSIPSLSIYNLYLAWVDNYFSTPSSTIISEGNYNYGARIAFGGYRFGMITVVRHISGTNFDPYYYHTTNGGTTGSSWSSGSIDASPNRTRRCDIIACRGQLNQFRISYSQDNPSSPSVFFRSWSAGVWSSSTMISNLPIDTAVAQQRAGYINGGADDCLGIWGGVLTGAYASRLCQTTVGIGKTDIPVNYQLSQNYPNPFNPITKIRFAIPREGFVELIILDLLGRKVKTLLDKQLYPGNHEIDFDGSNLPSGIYYYRLTINDYSETKKMVLIK